MNLFVLDADPVRAARALGDGHVNKMLIEAVQMLCNAFPEEMSPYKRTHYNQRVSKWVRANQSNYAWAMAYAAELVAERSRRFPERQEHASARVLTWCAIAAPRLIELNLLPAGERTPFAQAIPDAYRHADAVEAYREYYTQDKAHLARWENGRAAPEWARRMQ